MTKEDLFDIAVQAMGECLGLNNCKEDVRDMMMTKYDITYDEANDIVAKAYAEWIEAYTG